MAVYFDTSALAKRYVPEAGSDEVDAFLAAHPAPCVITPLVATELESILQRLARQRLIDSRFASQVRRDYAADLGAALWSMQPFEGASFARATALMRDLGTPLATLDALHLASALELGCAGIATSDRQLVKAAQAAGLAVHSFVV
jgi:uncharacterized protein